jgi:spermidine synthase
VTSNIEILAHEPSPLGTLCLRRRELLSAPGIFVTEVTLNGAFLMSSFNTASERALAKTAISMHGGSELRVLVGGLGLGYTAREVLAFPEVARLTVVEFLPQVIDWLERELFPLAPELKRDPRFQVVRRDLYRSLAGAPAETHDLILIDVDHSPDDHLAEANGWFYTDEGLRAAQAHLAQDGVLGVWSYAESSPFADALGRVFQEVRVEPVTFFNPLIDEEATDWLFFARR